MIRRLFRPHSLLSAILYLWKFQFYRRWWGGHWELWWVDITCSYIWHDVEECSLKTGERPHGFFHGTPKCEDYL